MPKNRTAEQQNNRLKIVTRGFAGDIVKTEMFAEKKAEIHDGRICIYPRFRSEYNERVEEEIENIEVLN